MRAGNVVRIENKRLSYRCIGHFMLVPDKVVAYYEKYSSYGLTWIRDYTYSMTNMLYKRKEVQRGVKLWSLSY
jgi:hypothetical protein